VNLWPILELIILFAPVKESNLNFASCMVLNFELNFKLRKCTSPVYPKSGVFDIVTWE